MEGSRFSKKPTVPQEVSKNKNSLKANKEVTKSHKEEVLHNKLSTNNDNKHNTKQNFENNLRILYTNADQLTLSKKQELENLLSQNKPHIIAICEVKPKKKTERQLQDYTLDGFIPYHTNTDSDKGRGIVVLVHHSISHLVLQVQSEIEFEEACLIEIKLKDNDVLMFACIYRSPTQSDTSEQNNENLNTLLRDLASNKKYTHKCLVGDFNFKMINWQHWSTPYPETSKEERFLEALRDTFFFQHVNEPTRSRGADEPSTIDLIITDEEYQISELKYLAPLGRSDHSVLSFNFNCCVEPQASQTKYYYGRADFASMKRYLDDSGWIENYSRSVETLSVEESWVMLKDKIIQLRHKHVPSSNKNEPVWGKKGKFAINQELRQAIKDKRRHHRKWIKSTKSLK